MSKPRSAAAVHYRQGDVLVMRVDTIPEGAQHVTANDGRFVLAYGEVTGHAHAIAEDDGVDAYAVDGVIRYLEIAATAPVQKNAWQCTTKNGETVFLPADANPADYLGLTIVGRADTPGAVLRHEEHHPVILTPGIYRHGGSDREKMQREYTPEAIRNVAD